MVEARRNTFKSPKPDAVRLLVYDILREVNRSDGYSNLLLPQALTATNFEQRDKGFATELLYGTLRMQGRHDYIASQVSNRPWSEVDEGIVDVVRLGAHQLFEMRVPSHAAVSATVELARKVIGESKASFVNALLRKMSAKSLEEWLEPAQQIKDPVERLAIIYSHPQWIVSAYFDLLRDFDEVEALLAANNVAAKPTIVWWPGRSNAVEFIELGATATRYSDHGFKFEGTPASLESVRHRRAGIQDEGSQLVAEIFAKVVADTDDWLDLCAGPGGKAALLSSLAKESGKRFSANEVSPVRAKLVEQVIGGARILVTDGREISALGEKFGAILADVPCTGLGALRRRPEVRWRRTVADLRELTQLQRELADGAISVLREGGFFGYATCSPHLAETSIAVSDILRKHPELEMVDLQPYLPSQLEGALRDKSLSLWTHRHETDAMYLAVFRKKLASEN
ncbi:Sun tRNA and rRNA cytosine-C5-methylases [Candidatus Nanopelagicaceae bacterium]